MSQIEVTKTAVGQMLTILPTKSNIDAIAKEIILDIEEGYVNGFECLAKFEAIKAICDQVRKTVEPLIRTELEKYGKEGNKVLEAKFDLAEVGVSYDYSPCPVWSALNKQMEEIKVKIKEREALLKVLSKPMAETDMETGETVQVNPPIKTSKSSFKITLSK